MTGNGIIGIDASRSYRSPMTGTERYSRRLIEHLVRDDCTQARYRLYFNAPPPTEANLGNAEIRTIPARRLWTHYRLSRELRADPVDLLFVPSHVLPLIHPERAVVTIHDLGYLYEPDAHTRASRFQLDATTRWNARQASHLIAISETTSRDLTLHYGVAPERITVVPHGVDEQFRILPDEAVERYRRAARLPSRFILYVGTVQPRKNIENLIAAFERCAKADPDLHLVIAGRTGWLSDPIRERARTSPVAERIRFLGYVPDPQLPLLYNAATAFALPSRYEGFGLPVLEALACGVPAVVSNRGALPEIAGADAAIVDPHDIPQLSAALTRAIAQRNDGERKKQRIQHATAYRWQRSAAMTRSILAEQLGIEPDGPR